jgi:hypothetical protein
MRNELILITSIAQISRNGGFPLLRDSSTYQTVGTTIVILVVVLDVIIKSLELKVSCKMMMPIRGVAKTHDNIGIK